MWCVLYICTCSILYGPVEQGKKMFHSTRIATIMLFFILMFLTVYLAFSSSKTSPLLMVALIIAQYLTLSWYSLSYVPWGKCFRIDSWYLDYFDTTSMNLTPYMIDFYLIYLFININYRSRACKRLLATNVLQLHHSRGLEGVLWWRYSRGW